MKKILIPIVIIIAVIAVILLMKDKPVDPLVPEENTTGVTNGGASGQFAKLAENALVVIDQQLTDFIIVNSLNMTNPGFVVVYRDRADGTGSDIIAVSKWFPAGQYAYEKVGTTERLKEGIAYTAELLADDGDGIFEPEKDKSVRDGVSEEGVMIPFSAKKDAPDPKSVQIYY